VLPLGTEPPSSIRGQREAGRWCDASGLLVPPARSLASRVRCPSLRWLRPRSGGRSASAGARGAAAVPAGSAGGKLVRLRRLWAGRAGCHELFTEL